MDTAHARAGPIRELACSRQKCCICGELEPANALSGSPGTHRGLPVVSPTAQPLPADARAESARPPSAPSAVQARNAPKRRGVTLWGYEFEGVVCPSRWLLVLWSLWARGARVWAGRGQRACALSPSNQRGELLPSPSGGQFWTPITPERGVNIPRRITPCASAGSRLCPLCQYDRDTGALWN